MMNLAYDMVDILVVKQYEGIYAHDESQVEILFYFVYHYPLILAIDMQLTYLLAHVYTYVKHNKTVYARRALPWCLFWRLFLLVFVDACHVH